MVFFVVFLGAPGRRQLARKWFLRGICKTNNIQGSSLNEIWTVKLFSCEGFPSVGTSRDGPSFAHHVAHYTASPGAVTSIMTKLAPAATIMWGSVILLKTKHLQRKPHDLDSPRQ